MSATASQPPKRFLRLQQVCDRTGLPSSSVYDLERAGSFPRRRKLSERSSAWLEHEVDEWIASRPLARPSET